MSGEVSSATSGQHKKQELRVKRLQAEHRKTYLFLGEQHTKPRAGENRARQHEWRGRKVTQARKKKDNRKSEKKKF